MSESPEAPKTLIAQLAYYATVYIVLMVFMAVAYPFAQQYVKPLAAFVFPISPNNSLLKTLGVLSAMYWGTVGLMLVVGHKRG